jgi:hypothetical protein
MGPHSQSNFTSLPDEVELAHKAIVHRNSYGPISCPAIFNKKLALAHQALNRLPREDLAMANVIIW